MVIPEPNQMVALYHLAPQKLAEIGSSTCWRNECGVDIGECCSHRSSECGCTGGANIGGVYCEFKADYEGYDRDDQWEGRDYDQGGFRDSGATIKGPGWLVSIGYRPAIRTKTRT